MPLSPEMTAAYEQFEASVTALLEASEAFPADTMVTGYVLTVAGVAFDDEAEPDSDEQETLSRQCSFMKRGQSPHLTRGIIECFLDQIRVGE